MIRLQVLAQLVLICCVGFGGLPAGCADNDDDGKDGNGETLPMELTKTEVWQALCNQLKSCAPELYQQVGGDSGCVQTVSVLLFSDSVCPPENYNSQAAAQCVPGVSRLTCEQFTQSIQALSLGGGADGFPEVCNDICLPVQQ